MAAASAPANPAAPRTATLCTEPSADLRELRLDGLPERSHVLVGEGPLGRAELEAKRKRAVALADLLAAVEVEHAHRVEQLAAALAHRLLDPRGREVLGCHHGNVLDDGGVGRHVAVRLLAGL